MSAKLQNSISLRFIFVGMIISFLFFMFDVVFDLRDHLNEGVMYSTDELIHLLFEAVSVMTLGAGILVTRYNMRQLAIQNERSQSTIKAIRHDFDELVHKRFEDWSLTKAERDVALLLLRGLSASDISDLRTTSVGTIKVQSHNVFKKAGVTSRVEFMSLFMDEFMDVGLNQAQ